MTRVRTDVVFGTLTDTLTNVATTMNSAGLANLAAVSSAEAIITLDPNRDAGAPEIVVVTAHTGSATSATIQRGQFGTAARQHAQGTEWVHGPIASNATSYATAADDQGDYVPMNAFETYTPTLIQSGTVTKTVDHASFVRIGRLIHVGLILTVTGSGTGGNAVRVGLPVAGLVTANFVVGQGFLFDASAVLAYRFLAQMADADELALSPTNTTVAADIGVTQFTAGLAAGDVISLSATYQAAS